MRSPLLVLGVSLGLLAIAAGCGGGSGTSTPSTAAPTTSASASSSPNTSPSSSSSPSTSPSSSSSPATTFTFHGSTASGTYAAGTTPAAANLAAYGSNNITVKATFVAPSSGSSTLNFSDALNNGDITPAGFVADNATPNYTPIIYFSAVNTGSQDLNFGTNVPTLQLGDTSLGSYTTCNFDVYGSQGNGTTASWFVVPNAGVPNASGVTVGGGNLSGGNNSVDFKAGTQQIIAVSCH